MRKNISETIREEMKDLHDAGLIDETTMRKFDKNSLEPAKSMSKQDVKRIRSKTHTSQPVFASYLNVTPAAIKQWENGERSPSGSAARLLQLIERKGLEIFEPIQVISKPRRTAATRLKSGATSKSGKVSTKTQQK